MTRLSNRAVGWLLAVAGIATVAAGHDTSIADILGGALLLLGTAATIGGLSLASWEARHGQ